MSDINSKLQAADNILKITEFLSLARSEDFISRPEAAGIFKEIIKETGFKPVQKNTREAPISPEVK